MWENLDGEQLQKEKKYLEDRVIDPGNNASHLRIYERTIAHYWITKSLMGHVPWEKLKKEDGDEVPIEYWKPHHDDTSMLNQKVDSIMATLGVLLPILCPTPSGVPPYDFQVQFHAPSTFR